MSWKNGILERQRRALIALGTVFLMLFSIADVFFCGLETTSSGMAMTMHADEHGDMHAHLGHTEGHVAAHDVIPTNKDGHHESGEVGHLDCVHHVYHGVSTMPGIASISAPSISETRFTYAAFELASVTLRGIERPPRV